MKSELLGTTVGRYRIISVIGQGGMGSVYKALDSHTGRLVALKILAPHGPPAFESAFLREAGVSARLHHPNILAVFEAGVADGRPYLAMEYVDGKSLAQILRERKSLDVDYAVAVVNQVGSALAAAHRHGLIHRDVKPQNILISADGRVLLCDFGLSMPPGEETMSGTGMVFGTPAYMAPEQAMGLPLDPRSDVFALGVVLYEALTGQHPFAPGGSKSVADLLKRVVEGEPLPLRALNAAVPVAMEPVVRRALEKDPSRRYQTAEDFVSALAPVAPDRMDRGFGVQQPPDAAFMPPLSVGHPGSSALDQPTAAGSGRVARMATPPRSGRLLGLAAAAAAGLVGIWYAHRVFPTLLPAATLVPVVATVAVVLALRILFRQRQSAKSESGRNLVPTSTGPLGLSAAPADGVSMIGSMPRDRKLSASPNESTTDESANATAMVPKYEPARHEILSPTLRDPTAGAWLLVLNGPLQGQQFRLGRKAMIGRATGNDVVLSHDIGISRRHLEIRLQDNSFRLRDFQSRAGTMVNGLKVQEHDLRDRDEIIVGDTTLLFINATEGALPVAESKRRLRDFASIWDELTRAAHDRQ